MKRFILLLVLFLVGFILLEFNSEVQAQSDRVRKSPKAMVGQTLGLDTEVTITYGRPGVKGRTIWGELVPYGLAPGNKYSDNKPYPWRAGANENTTVEFSKDVMVEGKTLAAGKYSLHMIPSKSDWEVIFNNVSDGWGSYKYNQAEDALRVTVTPVSAAHQEWLTYGFEEMTDNSATMFLHWEKLKVPLKITLP